MIFEPLFPLWALLCVGAVLLAALIVSTRRAPRHTPLRAAAAFVLLAVLANPVLREERREQRDDIGLILIDRSRSMEIGERQSQARAAAQALQQSGGAIEWQVADLPQQPGEPTRLGEAAAGAIGRSDTSRLGGVFVITDGISADTPDPSLLPPSVPLHQLVAGDPDLDDRRLVIESVPPFTVAGQSATITVRVDDPGADRVPLTVDSTDGTRIRRTIEANRAVPVEVPVETRGELDVAFSVPVRANEATAVNNRALARLSGVTDRLSVLLVSGRPYPGGRVWRDLFKADPNIDLVHFTILRLPTSFDPTPPQDLALIPFPVEELFQERLGDFDLIIFDRFDLTELMSPGYFTNLSRRVEQGGGLLVVAGPEFSDRSSIAYTDLDRVLPARPAGPPVSQAFRPTLTDLGRRHPVTSALAPGEGVPTWGRWESLARVEPKTDMVLMRGADDALLLMLDRVGDGRVGMLASSDIWYWARAVDGAGPHNELLRRISHWLMQEPDLAETQLEVSGRADSLRIETRSLTPLPNAVLTGPDGAERRIALDADGEADIAAAEDGLYAVSAGGLRRFALVGDVAEFSEIRPRTTPLDTAADRSGGGTFLLQDGVPSVRHVAPERSARGDDWAGVRQRRSGALIAIDSRPLIPGWAALLVLAALLSASWYRERN
ncbi:threonine dehydrogenase [Pacificimonas flava]|uniref:Threonine dehydrogenase n=1 Tax=Pacificimonas flava TaxID=1234595 RepID=M2U942_9SPHN|nr:threonine dehydrogenase [Pacificimonas flava]EMD84508.1 Threonine dehydrogenase [Pacificimonas flava]MBB5279620.1 hypothetical protein [Pacificimonas flava]